MNENSSQSHSVFFMNVEKLNFKSRKKFVSRMYLVDLAGNENESKTGLENVISALARSKAEVPYGDSKLTKLLKHSLGGNSRTTMVICCSPASSKKSETKLILRFGCSAKKVKNLVCVNGEKFNVEDMELYSEYMKEKYDKIKKLYKKQSSCKIICDESIKLSEGGDGIEV